MNFRWSDKIRIQRKNSIEIHSKISPPKFQHTPTIHQIILQPKKKGFHSHTFSSKHFRLFFRKKRKKRIFLSIFLFGLFQTFSFCQVFWLFMLFFLYCVFFLRTKYILVVSPWQVHVKMKLYRNAHTQNMWGECSFMVKCTLLQRHKKNPQCDKKLDWNWTSTKRSKNGTQYYSVDLFLWENKHIN